MALEIGCYLCWLLELFGMSELFQTVFTFLMHFCNSLQDEMFQKFNFDTEWAVRLISRITNDEDIPIEGDTIVKQVNVGSCGI